MDQQQQFGTVIPSIYYNANTTCLLNQNSIPIIILIRWEILDILLSTHTFCNSAILAIIVEHVLKIVTALPLVLTLKT